MSLVLAKTNTAEATAALVTATTALINGQDRFYAEILYRLRRKVDYTMPSMGVSLENGGTLTYNPDFVLANLPNLGKILVHECMHIICDHIPRGQLHSLPHSFVNVCADLAVNSLIAGFPDKLNFFKDGELAVGETCTVTNFRNNNSNYSDLQGARAFEYYVAYFKEKGDAPERGGGSDCHDGWDKIDAESARAIAQRLIADAVKGSKQAGQELPSNVRELVEQLMDSGVTWEDVLRRFPDTAEVYAKESSRMHRNRRYGITFPGSKPVRRCEVYIAFDVSGSISKEVVSKFDNCLREMSELGADLKVLFFDHQVYPVVDYAPGCFDNGQIPGGGGTLFGPVLERITELGGDGVIFLTDGLLGDTIEQPAYPIVWGILDGYKSPVTWGTEVIIK